LPLTVAIAIARFRGGERLSVFATAVQMIRREAQ
jgi:hypothetical protein